MGRLLAVVRIVAQRAMGNRRLLATVTVGVVLSAGLMSSVAIYSDAIRDLGLKHALEQEDPLAVDIRIFSSSASLDPELYTIRSETIDRLLEREAGPILDDVVHIGRTDTFFLTAPGGAVPEDDDRPRSNFLFMDDLADHVRLVEGAAPALPATPAGQAAPFLEVWIGASAARQHGVSVGDEFDLHPFWRLDAAPVMIRVVGIIEPIDLADPFWFGQDRFQVTTTSWPSYPFWVEEEAVTGILVEYLPRIGGSFEVFGFVDIGRINSRNASDTEARLRGLQFSVREQVARTSVETVLPDTISTYREKLFFTRLPLFALMVQIVGIALYYLVMVSNMLVERQAGEIALLKSRGASTRQVMGVYLIEGLFLCGVGVIAGPLLAAAAITFLGYTPAFEGLSGGSALDVNLSTMAFLLALLGVILALGALLLPAYRATRNSIVHYKQSLARPPGQTLFLKYYLDLVVVGIAAYAFYQLRQRGSLVTERLFGDLSADPLLLVTPTLFMLMIALVFLRVFPLVLHVASWAGRGLNGVTIPLGLWHLVRSPLHYSRLILLLLLATAVGMFAAGFRATLERSYDDRASYEAAAPARLAGIADRLSLPPSSFVDRIESTTGATDVSPVARLTGTYTAARFSYESFELLGLVPDDAKRMMFWRGDFASSSLDDLMGRLASTEREPAAVATVPAGARYFGLWAIAPLSEPTLRLGIRLQEPSGQLWEFRLFPFTEPDDMGWQFFVADLANPFRPIEGETPDISQPRQLDAVFLRLAGVPGSSQRHTIIFDDLQASNDPPPEGKPFTDPIIIEDFRSADQYVTIAGVSSVREPGVFSAVEVFGRPDSSGVRLDFNYEQGGITLYGFRPRSAEQTLKVLASQTFLDAGGLSVGDAILLFVNRQYVQAEIVGDFDYFPTWDPQGRQHLLVANLDDLQVVAGRVPFLASAAYPNEAWIGDPEGALLDAPALTEKNLFVANVLIQSELRAQAGSDPLIAASWEGILFISFASVLLLTALGFIVYSYLTAQSRSLEFAILRTMGFTGRQILAIVSFEQIFVIVAGVAVGTFLGMPLGRLMIDFMGVTERGEEVLPPLVAEVSWNTVATVYALLAVVFIGTILSLVVLYSRLAVHRALRMGEL
jgi:hypothetical protein